MKEMVRSSQKRKQVQSSSKPSPTKTAKPSKTISATLKDPFPTSYRPTSEECRNVRDTLMALDGFPPEFAKYRRNPPDLGSSILSISEGFGLTPVKPEPLDDQDNGSCGTESMPSETREESVLDGLVSILLSQNTTEINSRRAFESLKSSFPNWEDVLAADSKCIENAIKCGGLAVTKASCIKNLLTGLLEKRGKICLEYLKDLSVDEVKSELCQFKGIGPKTVACVLMFHLQQDDFPVDTHVFRITKAIGWVPEEADREKAYLHLNKRIPNELKFDLNCLLVTHGKICPSCTKKGGNHQRRSSCNYSCPLSNCCCNTDFK